MVLLLSRLTSIKSNGIVSSSPIMIDYILYCKLYHITYREQGYVLFILTYDLYH